MAGKGTRHRFELSRLEIAGVLVSGVAGLFVVFLLGIYAGRGLAERHVDGGEKIVRMAVAPAAEQTPGSEDGLTFYDTLGRERQAKGEGRAAADRPEAAVPDVEEAHAGAAPREQAKPAESAPIAKPAEPAPTAKEERTSNAEALAAAAQRAEPAVQPTPAAAVKAERSPTPPSAARVAVALASGASPTPVTRTGAKGDWSVQVSATRDPRTADAVLRRLKGKGYDAFVLKVRRRGETFYRVRVGHYASLDEAQQIVTRLRREPGVPEAFVASD